MRKLQRSLQQEKTANITTSQAGAGRTLPTEHFEQCTFVSYFRKTFKGVRIIAIPNGGWRDIRTAARLKAEGVSRGVPDLFVPQWGLWLEMKRAKGGTLSQEQSDWIEYLTACGYKAVVCAGCEAAMAAAYARQKELQDGTVAY